MTGIVCSMVGATFSVAAAAEVIRRKKSITAVGNAQVDTAQSKFGGSSALFDGAGTPADHLLVSTTSSESSGQLTFEGWVRFAALPNTGNSGYMMWYVSSATSYILFQNDRVQVAVAGAYYRFVFGSNFSTNTWYHIAVVRDANNDWFVYRDGVKTTGAVDAGDTDVNKGGNWLPDGSLIIGKFTDDRGGFNGWMDELRISNSARYTTNFTAPTAPFVNDANTLLLIHADGTDASTYFEDDNGLAPFSTRTAKTVTAYGNAQVDTAQYKFGSSSLLLDGTGDYLFSPSNSEFGFGTNDFTIEGWYRFTNFTNGPALVDMRAAGGTEVKPVIYCGSDGTLNYYVNGAARITGSALSTATWYHIAVSRSGTSTKMFVNGSQVGSTYTDTNNYPATVLSIGIASWNTSFNAMNGWIDEFRVSNTARYTANFTAPTGPFNSDSKTLLLLHMEGTDASTTFTDDVYGVRTQKGIAAIGNAQIDTAQSKFGGSSALFDGTGDYLSIDASDLKYLSGDFTFECWARWSSVTAEQTLFELGNNATDGIQIYNLGSAYSYSLYPDIVNRTGAIASSGVSANTWYHIAMVRSGSTVTTYLNGTSIATMTYSATVGNGGNFTVGSSTNNTRNFGGWIDELRVSNTARYTANFTAPTAPFQNDANTLLLLHMDGTDASTIFVDDNSNTTKLDSLNSLSNVSWNWNQYQIYQVKNAGNDSTGRPVFLYAYREVSTNYAKTLLFRVNSDLTITQGSTTTITTSAVSDGVVAAVDTDNNYGYVAYNKTAGGVYAKTFTIDKDNLSLGTPGSEATLYASSDAGIVSADYAGDGRVHYFHRRGGQVSGNFYTTRSGTTLSVGTEIVGDVGAGTVYTQLRTFTKGTNLYRHAIISGNGSPQLSAMYWNGTSGSSPSSATAISWGTGAGIQNHHLVRLKSADKFMILTSGASAVQVCAGTITWPTSGTSAPTVSVGSPVTVIAAANNQTYGAIDGFANDTAYVIIKSGTNGRFYYSKITASSNSLTAGPLIPIDAGIPALDNYGIACTGVEAFSKKFIVGVCDNTASTSPDIFVVDVT